MPQTVLRPEHELLLLCSRSVLDPIRLARAGHLISRELDWQLLVRSAQAHRVFPLLYTHIVRHFPDTVPAHFAGEVKTQHLKNSAFNLFLSRQLLQILNLFAAQDIQAVPFKGPVLAEYLFGDINARSFVDLDILIARADLEKAVRLLRSAGFRFDIDLNLAQYLKLAGQGYHAALIRAHFPFMVELHWELSGRYLARGLGLADVRPRLRKALFLEQEIVSLAPTDLLVYLCIHGSRHYWLQLDHICCVAELLAKERDLDWELAVRLADGYGARRMLLLGCHLARELLGARLHPLIAGEVEDDPAVGDVGGWVVQMLFAGPEEKWRRMSYWRKVHYHWLVMGTVADCVRLGMMPLFQPTHSDWEWLRLPASVAWLYHVLRPARLGVKYGRKLLQ